MKSTILRRLEMNAGGTHLENAAYWHFMDTGPIEATASPGTDITELYKVILVISNDDAHIVNLATEPNSVITIKLINFDTCVLTANDDILFGNVTNGYLPSGFHTLTYDSSIGWIVTSELFIEEVT